VTGIFVSRMIFQRMKNFVIYRVACTVQLLFFFFLSTVFFAPHEVNPLWTEQYFAIPVIALVSITILNDGTIVSVAYDNVNASSAPEKWNLPSLYIISTAIGATCLVSSIILLQWALHCKDPDSTWVKTFGLPDLDYSQVQTVMYLKVSLSNYASVFNARCQGWMWSRAPSAIVLVAACFAMAIATLLSMYAPPGTTPICFKCVVFVWVYCILWAFVQDAAKIATYALLEKTEVIQTVELIDPKDICEFRRLAELAEQAAGQSQSRRSSEMNV